MACGCKSKTMKFFFTDPSTGEEVGGFDTRSEAETARSESELTSQVRIKPRLVKVSA